MRVFFYFIFTLLFFSIFFVNSHTDVWAESVVATVTILPGPAPVVTPKTQSATGTTFIAPAPVLAQPIDNSIPLFISPVAGQIKPDSFFDNAHLVQFVPASSDSLTLHWYSNEAVKYSFAYGETTAYETAEFSSISFFEGNFVQIASLVLGRTYFGKILITDRSGNNAVHVFSFIVPPASKTEEILTNVNKPDVFDHADKKTVEKLEKKEENIIADIKKIVDVLLMPNEEEKTKENSSVELKKLPPDISTGKEKYSVNIPIMHNAGQYRSDKDVISLLITKFIPKQIKDLSIAIIQPILPQIKTAGKFFNRMNLPSTPVFIMPSVINGGYSMIETGIMAVRGLFLETKSTCASIRVDGPVGFVVTRAIQLLGCR